MERYQKEMSELYFTEAGKRKLMEALAEQNQPDRRCVRRRTLAIGVAAALALTITAGALSPTVQEMLSDALGGFGRYAQTVEGTAVDQGIEVKVLSAIADSAMLVVYAEAKDLTGDRLGGGSLSVEGIPIPMQEGEIRLTGGIFSRECVGYDVETKTALLKFTFSYSEPVAVSETKNLSLQVNRFQPRDYFVEAPLPDWELTDQTLRGWYLEEENVLSGGGSLDPVEHYIGALALEPGQTPADLGSDLVSLSSAGFGADGRFHLQFEVPAETQMGSSSLLSNLRSRYLQTLDLEGDEGIAEATRVGMAYNDPLTIFWFTRDGKVYTELVFPAGPDTADDLRLESVYGSVVLAEAISGCWEIPLTVETLPELRIPLSGTINGVQLEEMTLSPLSVAISSTNYGLTQKPLSAWMKDGSEITAERTGSSVTDNIHAYDRWAFEEPVELDDLTGISIGEWFIPIEDGAAGEVRPLS